MGSLLSSLVNGGEDSSSSSSEQSRVITFHSSDRWQFHFNESQQIPKLMVVDFSASWCPPCKFIGVELHRLSAKFPDVEFVKIDVDELKDVAQEFGVQQMPTFVLLKQGKEVDRIVGARKDELVKKVEEHRLKPEFAA